MPEKPQDNDPKETFKLLEEDDFDQVWDDGIRKCLERADAANADTDAQTDLNPATGERKIADAQEAIKKIRQGGENWLIDHLVRVPPRPTPRPKPEPKPDPKPVPAAESIPKPESEPALLNTIIEIDDTKIEVMAEDWRKDDILAILTAETPGLTKENATFAEKIATYDFKQITFKAKNKPKSERLQEKMLPDFCAEAQLGWDYDEETSIFTIGRIPGKSYENKIMDAKSRAFVIWLLGFMSTDLKIEPVDPPFTINLSFPVDYDQNDVTKPFIGVHGSVKSPSRPKRKKLKKRK